MVGSIGLNARFEEDFKKIIGVREHARLYQTAPLMAGLKYFDQNVKPGFQGDLDAEYHVNFPMANLADNKRLNLANNCWSMSG